MPPCIVGGEMIREVRFDGTVFNDAPHKFEAGTPNIAGFAGLGAAVDYLDALGMDNVEALEQELQAHLAEELAKIEGMRVYGTAPEIGRAPSSESTCQNEKIQGGADTSKKKN